MITTLVRKASLRLKLWWLRQEVEMANDPVKRRRRAATKPASPPPVPQKKRKAGLTQPEIVGEATEANLEDGIVMPKEVLAFFLGHPLLERRRMHFTSQELVQLIAEALMRRGMPGVAVAGSRWLWVGKNGCPELFLILPGIEA